MLREKDAVIRRAMIILDACLLSLAFILSYMLRDNFRDFYRWDLIPSYHFVTGRPAALSDYLVVLFLIIPTWCLMLYTNGMYASMRTRKGWELAYIIVKSAFLTVLVFSALVFLFKLEFVSRLFFGIFIFTGLLALILEKGIIFSIMHYVRKQGYNFRRLLVVGTGDRAANFIAKIRKHPEWGLRIEGALDYEKRLIGQVVEGIEVVGTLDDLADILHSKPIDEVIFIVPRSVLSDIENSLYVCETVGVNATIAVDLFELKIAKARQTELEDIPLLTFETQIALEWQLFLKRAFDIAVSLLGLIILSPLFLVISALIKLTSKGPVLYIQKRVGLNGRIFNFCKFRTMYVGSHERVDELADRNIMNGPVFKVRNDPRVTKIGRALRKFSLDEFPQLFNVLIGHMSLVGIRPPLPNEVEQYKPWQRRRLSMRPGLTCLWQISGRNNIDFEEWMRMDLEYLDNWSLWLDLKILIKTVPIVLFGIGGY